jgi:hypothetical protein
MIMNGRDKYLGNPEYFLQPGLTRASALWLVERGVKVIGVDMYSLDRNFEAIEIISGDGRREAPLGSGSAGVVGYTEEHDRRRNNPNPRVPPLRQQ